MKKEIINNYFVNAQGEVFNKKGKKKASFVNDHGYEIVFLWKDNKSKSYTVHRLVAQAFISNPENKPCVNHIDGNKLNNEVNNLEWCTYSENTIHALENGLKVPELGEDVHNSILTNTQVHEICQMMQKGYRDIEISESLKIDRHYVSNIRHGKSWVFISSEYDIPKKSVVLSEETIHWICSQIQADVKNKDIVALSNNAKVTKSVVTKIKNKKQYKHISYLYNF